MSGMVLFYHLNDIKYSLIFFIIKKNKIQNTTSYPVLTSQPNHILTKMTNCFSNLCNYILPGIFDRLDVLRKKLKQI